VIPQYEVAGKRIDLVVEDRERRLAVECDGDAWHGPDRYEADMARQRMLERCGWKFIRVRGSIFYANRSKAIRDLIDAINAHGIEPHVVTDDEVVPRNWVEEVSGNQCMEALGAYKVDTAEENIVQQPGLFPEDSEEDASNGDSQGETQARDSRVPPAGVQRLLGFFTPESASPATSSTPTSKTATNPPFTIASPPQHLASSATIVVSVQERKAVLKALDEAGKPLIMWKLSERSQISQSRLEKILPILAREGVVNRIEAADAVRYSAA
jgi:hypothetical protein